MELPEVRKIVDEQKKRSFVNPDDTSDEDAMGLVVAHFFDWDGLAILKTAYAALEDANFHTENETIEKMIKRLEMDTHPE